MCPFNRGNKYKDFVNIFPGPKFVSPEWRYCPLNSLGVPRERFQCIALLKQIQRWINTPLISLIFLFSVTPVNHLMVVKSHLKSLISSFYVAARCLQ